VKTFQDYELHILKYTSVPPEDQWVLLGWLNNTTLRLCIFSCSTKI